MFIFLMIRRPPGSTQGRSSAASDVYKRQVGGNTITFPVEIPTGSYLEFRGMTDCKLYGPNGEFVADVTPQGTAPVLAAGANPLAFGCEAPVAPNPRARVTVITLGDTIG